jgi:DNA-binding NarL/FixJ family response regulator
MRATKAELTEAVRGASIAETSYTLAVKTGWSQASVMRIARQIGKSFTEKLSRSCPRGLVTGEEQTLILQMFDDGVTVRQIADRLGRTAECVRNQLAKISPTLSYPPNYDQVLLAEQWEWQAQVEQMKQWRRQQRAMSARL